LGHDFPNAATRARVGTCLRALALVGACFLGGAAFGDEPRLGVNFLRFFWERGDEAAQDTDEILSDLKGLGVHAMRQLVRADLLWREVEPTNDAWDFSRADAILAKGNITPIVTLFSMQYASATPPWAQGPGAFRPVMGPAARDYVETVVTRYRDRVRYWEIGNEMDHWRVSAPGSRRTPPGRRPPHTPPGGFTPEQQGQFVAQVAKVVRSLDPDAVILMPSVAGLSPYVLEEWLPGFVRGAGIDGFDVVGYHFYGGWPVFAQRRMQLSRALKKAGIAKKPVWLTETGTSGDALTTLRTNYPNSETEQAADVFRPSVLSWAAGDAAVFWHSHLSSPNRPYNRWRAYGLRRADGSATPAHTTMGLLANHLASFTEVKPVPDLDVGRVGYEFTRSDGASRWVFWGEGRVIPPARAKAYTSVIAGEDGAHHWRGMPDSLQLSTQPVLMRN